MKHIPVADGVELEVDYVGSGEAVVLIHGAGIADAFLPLAAEPVLRDHYRLIRYRRRGHGASTPITGLVSVADHAQDCRALLGAFGIEQAHVVGHSYGGCVAAQLAIDTPGVVHSLALLEPVLAGVPSTQQFFEAVSTIRAKLTAGDHIAAADDFFTLMGGPDWRAEVSRTVPGGPEQVENDAATLAESSSLHGWHFGAEEVAQITQPVFFLHGTESLPFYLEGRDLVASWLPHTEFDVLPGANHLLQMQHPADAAARLAAFLHRHPIAGRCTSIHQTPAIRL